MFLNKIIVFEGKEKKRKHQLLNFVCISMFSMYIVEQKRKCWIDSDLHTLSPFYNVYIKHMHVETGGGGCVYTLPLIILKIVLTKILVLVQCNNHQSHKKFQYFEVSAPPILKCFLRA